MFQTLVNVVPNSSNSTDQPEITVVEETAREDIETRLHSTAQTLESTKQVRAVDKKCLLKISPPERLIQIQN